MSSGAPRCAANKPQQEGKTMTTTAQSAKALGLAAALALGAASAVNAAVHIVSDEVVAGQRAALAKATDGKGFGPQSPRDIDQISGENTRVFEAAPDYREMNLCNIHFHEAAEHRGGQFTKYAGNGDGEGYGTGFLYSGSLTDAELAPVSYEVGAGMKGDLQPGDTIELHYVHTTAQIVPGPTLGACLSDSIMNPQLRVEGIVYVLVNDRNAADFMELTKVEKRDGYFQAVNIPLNAGDPVQYAGSTTGPSFNEKGSPLQVSWSMRPNIIKVDIATVKTWLGDNIFDEKKAHGVRNLVTNPSLLSPISN